jgi:PAS domain S-box-containing protein
VNRQAYKILGYPEDSPVTGISTLDFYIPEDRPRAVENIKRRLMGQQEGSNEYTMVRTDGTLLNVLVYQ